MVVTGCVALLVTRRSPTVLMLLIVTVPFVVRPTTSEPELPAFAVDSADVVRAVLVLVAVVVVTLERALPRPGVDATVGEIVAAEVIVGVSKPPALLMTGAAVLTVDVVALATVFAATVGDTVVAAVVGVTRPAVIALVVPAVVATPLATAPPLPPLVTTSVGSELIVRLTVICGLVNCAGLMNCPVSKLADCGFVA